MWGALIPLGLIVLVNVVRRTLGWVGDGTDLWPQIVAGLLVIGYLIYALIVLEKTRRDIYVLEIELQRSRQAVSVPGIRPAGGTTSLAC